MAANDRILPTLIHVHPVARQLAPFVEGASAPAEWDEFATWSGTPVEQRRKLAAAIEAHNSKVRAFNTLMKSKLPNWKAILDEWSGKEPRAVQVAGRLGFTSGAFKYRYQRRQARQQCGQPSGQSCVQLSVDAMCAVTVLHRVLVPCLCDECLASATPTCNMQLLARVLFVVIVVVSSVPVQPASNRRGKRLANDMDAFYTRMNALAVFHSEEEMEAACAAFEEAESNYDYDAVVEENKGTANCSSASAEAPKLCLVHPLATSEGSTEKSGGRAGVAAASTALVADSGKSVVWCDDPDPGDHKLRLTLLLLAARDRSEYTDEQLGDDTYAEQARESGFSFKRGDVIGVKVLRQALYLHTELYKRFTDHPEQHPWPNVQSAVSYIRKSRRLMMVRPHGSFSLQCVHGLLCAC